MRGENLNEGGRVEGRQEGRIYKSNLFCWAYMYSSFQ